MPTLSYRSETIEPIAGGGIKVRAISFPKGAYPKVNVIGQLKFELITTRPQTRTLVLTQQGLKAKCKQTKATT